MLMFELHIYILRVLHMYSLPMLHIASLPANARDLETLFIRLIAWAVCCMPEGLLYDNR